MKGQSCSDPLPHDTIDPYRIFVVEKNSKKMSSDRKEVYLDYNATTPLAPEVLQSVTVALRDCWANPSSGHEAGKQIISFSLLG